VVTSDADVKVACLDGFTITGGSIAGVYCEEGSPIIQHNKIMTSGAGIYCFESEQPVIINNWIYRNNYGLYLDQAANAAVVRNNTVVYNDEVGIFFESGIKPLLTNCILWGNGDESIETQLNWEYLEGLFVRYSCVQDSNDVTPQPPYYTINTDPCFAAPDQVDPVDDNYHLKADSPCIDAGDPNGNYGGERDIDKHFRVLDGDGDGDKRVDMGADEYCNQGDENDADFNGDGIVNYIDFAIFSKAWLSYGPYSESDPNTYNWNPVCDISEPADNVIDANDLIVFAEEWLWIACWKMESMPMMEMMMGMAGGESMVISEPAAEQQVSETQSEPSVSEQIEMAKRCLEFWYRQDVREGIEDEAAWLRIVTSLEDMLEELEGY
jgi:parallel beta-helix repeat protein